MTSVVDAAAVTECLGAGTDYASWVRDLEAVGPPPVEPRMPVGEELRQVLDRLAVLPEDAEEVAATSPTPDGDPELWWLLQRCHRTLVRGMGDLDAQSWLTWPDLPESFGARGRYFFAHVMLAALPDVRRWHQSRGLPDDVCWATLADLGRHLAIRRRINGRGGLDVQGWFGLHFRGLIFDLGRLQFNRGRAWVDDAELVASGAPFRPNDPVLGVHIPESGPMTPEACDESFRRAREFYDRYFPEERYRYATCGSWLLDPQLAEYLPESSNIVAFQRRFRLFPEEEADGDKAVFEFVFRLRNPRVADLPRRTALERAVVEHLEAGRHWKTRAGWVEL